MPNRIMLSFHFLRISEELMYNCKRKLLIANHFSHVNLFRAINYNGRKTLLSFTLTLYMCRSIFF